MRRGSPSSARATRPISPPTSSASPARRFVAVAKQLQDILGDHQDAVVAQERIRDWAESATAPESGFAAGTARPARARPDGGRPRRVARDLAAARRGGAAGGPLSTSFGPRGGVRRPGAARTAREVLLVHRPAYDDWTLPEGEARAAARPTRNARCARSRRRRACAARSVASSRRRRTGTRRAGASGCGTG